MIAIPGVFVFKGRPKLTVIVTYLKYDCCSVTGPYPILY